MTFKIQRSSQANAETLISHAYETLLQLKEVVEENIVYLRQTINELDEVYLDVKGSEHENLEKEIEAHTRELSMAEINLDLIQRRIERMDQIRILQQPSFFVIKKDTTKGQLKQLMQVMDELLEHKIYKPFLKTLYEWVETRKEQLGMEHSTLNEDIEIPVLPSEQKLCDYFIYLEKEYDKEYSNADAFGKYAIFLHTLECNADNMLDEFIQEMMDDRDFMPSRDCANQLKEIYTVVLEGMNAVQLSNMEQSLFTQIKDELSVLIKSGDLPIAENFKIHLRETIQNNGLLTKAKPLSLAAQTFINSLFKVIQEPPPFVVNEKNDLFHRLKNKLHTFNKSSGDDKENQAPNLK